VARDGWRFNDRNHPIFYSAEVQSLAILEVVARPGWSSQAELCVACLRVPEGSVVDLGDLSLTLTSNWNVRPAAANAQRLGAEFLRAMDQTQATGRRLCGVRVPSVISSVDHNVLLDPRQADVYTIDSCVLWPDDSAPWG